ncbi:hypothetical protein [Streptomyces sp. MBT65]|nr:hypothetical protein [Streptomyces sp. MBT65]
MTEGPRDGSAPRRIAVEGAGRGSSWISMVEIAAVRRTGSG